MKWVFRAIPFLLIGAIFLSLLFFPHERAEAEGERIVEIWNIDTFEGGKGSRTSFLLKAADKVGRDGVYYCVLSYTPAGARKAISEGKLPDMLSFGVGFSDLAANFLPLGLQFYAAKVNGKTLAVPWCMGGYFLFCLEDNFEGEGSCAISKGGENLVEVAAALADIHGEILPSEEAYVRFLSGDFRYLLGTQRDVKRFEARGKAVYKKELSEYNDLYQYISILSKEKRGDCEAFLDVLLSEEVQGDLQRIGMGPPSGKERYTAAPFCSNETLSLLRSAAIEGQEINFLEKYLKSH